ncbi:hypothetical protein PIB30_013597 [Stylosanthes scabra]|uniref:Uncharacterized protein n=1 Tax=Stylosanthes scabra TaxID=79078 RepID=A0ABU6T6R0_9FABA|nr:hypothetical protein [Stylosanthes scabra]
MFVSTSDKACLFREEQPKLLVGCVVSQKWRDNHMHCVEREVAALQATAFFSCVLPGNKQRNGETITCTALRERLLLCTQLHFFYVSCLAINRGRPATRIK